MLLHLGFDTTPIALNMSRESTLRVEYLLLVQTLLTLRCQRRQPAHRSHLIHRQHACLKQLRLNLDFRQLISCFKLVERKLELMPAKKF